MRFHNHIAPGIGQLMPGMFVLPQNPLRPVMGRPRIGEIIAARFPVPQNPIIDALGKGVGMAQTGPGAAWRRAHGLQGLGCGGGGGQDCGCGCGGSGGGSGACNPGVGGLSGLEGLGGLEGLEGLGTLQGTLDQMSGLWDEVSSYEVMGVPVVYPVAAFLAWYLFFRQPVKSRAPSRYQRVRRKLAAAAEA